MTHVRRFLAIAVLAAMAAAAPAAEHGVPTAYREEIRSVLRTALEGDDPAAASAAAAGLARSGDGTAAPTLRRLLAVGDEAARRSSAEGLGDLGDRAALPDLLVSLLKDCDPAVRGAAAVAAARVGGGDAGPYLRGEFDRSFARADRRRGPSLAGLAEALGMLADGRDIDRLAALLYDRSAPAEARAAAAGALANYIDPHAVVSLVDALHDDPSPEVRRAAALGLSWMARDDAREEEEDPVTLFADTGEFSIPPRPARGD